MARLGAGLALAAGVLLSACSEGGGVPIYVGGDLLTTVGAPAPAAANGTAEGTPDRSGFGLGSIFASDGTPVYVGGRRINCPEGQPDC